MNETVNNYNLTEDETYNFLVTTWNAQINDNGNGIKRKMFNRLVGRLLNDSVISGIRMNERIRILIHFERISKCDFYNLIANIFQKFFSGKITQEYYVLLGESVFNCNGKAHKTLYNNISNHINSDPPNPYINFF